MKKKIVSYNYSDSHQTTVDDGDHDDMFYRASEDGL